MSTQQQERLPRSQRRGARWRKKSTVRRTGPVLVGLGAILVLVAIGAFPGGGDSEIHDFGTDVDGLVVEATGAVDITVGESAVVQVHRRWGWLGPRPVSVESQDGTVRIDGRCNRVWILGAGCDVRIEATVPAQARVEVVTAAGAVRAADVEGGVDLASSAGAIEVDHVRGPAVLTSSAGAIRGVVVGGDVEAVTSAGPISLTVQESLASLTARSSAGAVDLTVPDDVYDIDFDTSAGDVELDVRMDPDASRSIDARSTAGDVTIRREVP